MDELQTLRVDWRKKIKLVTLATPSDVQFKDEVMPSPYSYHASVLIVSFPRIANRENGTRAIPEASP